MNYIIKICIPLVLLGLLFLSACSYSKINMSWRDDAYPAGQLKRTMVLVVVENQSIRLRLEDELAFELRKLGVDATQGYKIFPDIKKVDIHKIRANFAVTGQDSLLVTRVTDSRSDSVYVPPVGGYAPMWDSTGLTYDFKVFTLQNNLYAARDEKLVWTAVTTAEEPPSDLDATIKDYARMIVEDINNKKIY